MSRSSNERVSAEERLGNRYVKKLHKVIDVDDETMDQVWDIIEDYADEKMDLFFEERNRKHKIVENKMVRPIKSKK